MLNYATLDIFFLMYLGNEIKISSGKLPYYLYESNWIEQSGRCKRIVIVLAEVLKRHQVIMVAKLYALSLETFNAVRVCVGTLLPVHLLVQTIFHTDNANSL